MIITATTMVEGFNLQAVKEEAPMMIKLIVNQTIATMNVMFLLAAMRLATLI